jgi:putative intracellular protease/amidase
VTILSPKLGEIQGVRHDIDKTIKVKVDRTIRDARPEEFDAVHLPGGALNADAMRMLPEVQSFLRKMREAGKPLTVICHAPWELVSAGLVRGRTLTSYYTLQDDIRNAGGPLGRPGSRGGRQLGKQPVTSRHSRVQQSYDQPLLGQPGRKLCLTPWGDFSSDCLLA